MVCVCESECVCGCLGKGVSLCRLPLHSDLGTSRRVRVVQGVGCCVCAGAGSGLTQPYPFTTRVATTPPPPSPYTSLHPLRYNAVFHLTTAANVPLHLLTPP